MILASPTNTNSPEENTLEQFRLLCQKHGIKLTYQRLEIFRVLLSSTDHPTAEEIYARVKEKVPTISLDTIYRTLTTFEELGLVKRFYLFDDKARFDPNTKPHFHLICTKCQKILDFYWPEIKNIKIPDQVKKWGKINQLYLEFRGVCRQCQKK